MKNGVYLHISESESSRTRECRNSLLGKNSGVGQMPRAELCSLLSESLETPAKAHAGLPASAELPGTQGCFSVFGGRPTPRYCTAARITLVLKLRALTTVFLPERTLFRYTRTRLENIKMDCCRLENQLGKKGKTSGVILRI